MGDPTEYDREQDARQQERDAAQDRAAGQSAQDQAARDQAQDDAASRRARDQAARDQAQDDRVAPIDEFILTPGEVAANPAAQPASDGQRLRIHVPNVQTTISLGVKAPGGAITEADTGAPNYDGFGVHTMGHLFLTASKDRADSTATLQAKGDVVVQSEQGLVWVGGKEQTLVASPANAMMMGGGGVVIAGGAAVTWADNPEPDASVPSPPGWMSGFGAAGGGINQVWAGIDAAVAVATGIKGVISAATSRPTGLDLALAVANLALGNLGGAIVSGLGAANSDPIGGTVIHGTGGVIVGSSHTMGLYSLTGTTVASVLGVSVLAPSVGVTGFNDATVEAGRGLELKSGGEAALTGSKKTIVASRTADLQVLGKEIYVGSDPADEGATQAKTTDLNLFGQNLGVASEKMSVATDELSFRVDGDGGIGASGHLGLSGQGVGISAEKGVAIAGGECVRLGAGDFSVLATKNMAFIGKASKAIANKPSPPARHRKKKIRARNKADYEARLKSWQEANVKANPGACGIQMKAGWIKLTVKGNEFKIDSGKFKTGSLVWKK